MALSKDVIMQNMQRFGGAMYTPVILFAFFGLTVAVSIVCKNEGLLGSIAAQGTLWYDFWFVVEQGAWTVFAQMPILFAIAVPIGFAKKEPARCAMESFVIYMLFNYFISAFLMLHGSAFGVDYSQPAGPGTGLAMIANVKTLDMGMLGAIFIACCTAFLHNHFYDTDIPDWLGIFKGPAFVVAIGFAVMIPMALLFCIVWPAVQHAIEQFQFFLKTSGIIGVWAYTFSEKILLPAGLHHFIYLPFVFGPAVVDGGIQAYWLGHINDFMVSGQSLRELFPEGGFALHGSGKVFGLPGAALAIYMCAKPEKRKKTAALLIPATITAVLCGITEPIEFTFLFVAPLLYLLHAVLSATLSATLYAIGLSGNFGGGLIDCFVQNWIPLFSYHYATYLMQIAVGLCFTAIYFFVFRFVIQLKDYKTPGRTDDGVEDKLFTKADYKAREGGSAASGDAPTADEKSAAIARGLGSKRNITSVDCCATRLRCSVADSSLVNEKLLKATGAVGVIVKGTGVQVIYGPQVAVIKSNLETYLMTAPEVEPEPDAAPEPAPAAEKPAVPAETAGRHTLCTPVTGTVHPITEAPDEAFAGKMMGDGYFIDPSVGEVVAPADGEVVFVFDTKHAIGMKSADGTEYLLHIGVDTVALGGKGFEVFVESGQQVKKGDKLMTFDIDYIRENAKSDACLVIFTGLGEGQSITMEASGEVKALDPVASF